MSEALERRTAEKDAVLEAALLHAAFDGWNRRTLANAAAECGHDAATARRLFPQGGESLLDWLEDWADRRMLERLRGTALDKLPVRRRIFRLVQARFQVLEGHEEAMRRAALARGMPTSLPGAGRALWRTTDVIWKAAGFAPDPAEGISFYTRRASLAGVLLSTFLFWLDDRSEGHEASWAFLERRIENALQLGKLTGRLKGLFPGGRHRTAGA